MRAPEKAHQGVSGGCTQPHDFFREHIRRQQSVAMIVICPD
jgi:hypothetical protein